LGIIRNARQFQRGETLAFVVYPLDKPRPAADFDEISDFR
jgi:hypothetical protein